MRSDSIVAEISRMHNRMPQILLYFQSSYNSHISESYSPESLPVERALTDTGRLFIILQTDGQTSCLSRFIVTFCRNTLMRRRMWWQGHEVIMSLFGVNEGFFASLSPLTSLLGNVLPWSVYVVSKLRIFNLSTPELLTYRAEKYSIDL